MMRTWLGLSMVVLAIGCSDTGEGQRDEQLGAAELVGLAGQPAWIGNAVARITRESGHPCAGGVAIDGPVAYGSWARQRAVLRNVCFEVWEPGITDWANPELWRELDARVYWRKAGGEWRWEWVGLVDRTGNNARYAVDLRRYDPFANTGCGGSGSERQDVELYFSVNGKKSGAVVVRYETCS